MENPSVVLDENNNKGIEFHKDFELVEEEKEAVNEPSFISGENKNNTQDEFNFR